MHGGKIPLGEALDKIYLIKNWGGYTSEAVRGCLSFPSCLIGKRVKLRLVSDDETRRDMPEWMKVKEKMKERYCSLCKKEIFIADFTDKNVICHECLEILVCEVDDVNPEV